MKIDRVETFLVAPRWLFLKITTDDGVVGWGEPVVEGRAETVRAAIGELSDLLIGADPMRIEDHWQVLTRGGFYRGGPVLSSTVAGIDQALWDIAGKVRGAPVHELLGGPVRDRVRMYGWAYGETAGQVAEAAATAIAAGYTAVKIAPPGPMAFLDTPAGLRSVVDLLAKVRDAIGPDNDVAIDLHGRASIPASRRLLPLLEPYVPLFVEEPLRPEYSSDIARIVTATSSPIATGERLYTRREFRDVLDAGVAVVQPDLSHAGGISEVRRIAAVAEMYDAVLAPHCPLGPIALAACLQIDLATPNFLIQEQALGLHHHHGQDGLNYLVDTDVLRLRDGHVERLDAPGLGIDVDEKAVREAAARGHRFRSPIWRGPDGAFTEW
ncbi:galactonate dehydratase [Sphaerisporangium sp. NPDC005289]|uniref:galactonate dehydratase n=1 Tax=Sphaerisporangium sp. NPDC005289 TaxID=3155247 RepID=UPI0033A592DC